MTETQETAGANASVREIAEARRTAGDWLGAARAEPDIQPSTPGFDPQNKLAKVHARVFRFYDVVRPYRGGAEELWFDQPVAEFPLQVRDQKKRVAITSLENLASWRNREIAQTKHQQLSRPGNPATSETQVRRVFLPLNTLQAAFDLLSDVVFAVDLAAPVDTTGVKEAKGEYGDLADPEELYADTEFAEYMEGDD